MVLLAERDLEAEALILVLVVAFAGIVMLIDWWAVLAARVRVEEVAKPLVMVGLIAVALTVESPVPGVRPWIVGGLLFGLLGDVFLLPRLDNFIAGLASFLVGHVLYVIGLARIDVAVGLGLIGIVWAVCLLAIVGRRVVQAVRRTDLFVPVVAYNLVIAAMVVAAFASGQPLAIAGALAFATSDAILGFDRFVLDGPPHRIQIMVLYHLGQAGLVAGMALASPLD